MQGNTNIVAKFSRGRSCHQLSCSFVNTSATHCIAIISEKAQTITKYGLLNIEVYNFTRKDDDTATGCLPHFITADFNIDVFTYQDNMLSEVPTQVKFTSGKLIAYYELYIA